MKYYNHWLLVFVVLFFFTMSFSVGSSAQIIDLTQDYPISLCDYTAPETVYRELGLKLNYHFYDDPNLSDEGDINKGGAFGNYSYIYSRPDYSLNLDSNASFSLSKGELTYDASGSGSYNAYLTEDDLFAFGGLGVNLSSDFSQVIGLRVITGTGWGRFKNVTPMVKSALISRMLLEREIISENLSQYVVGQIAEEIGQLSPETKTGVGLEAVIDEIVSIIEANASLQVKDLGPIEVLRIREIVENGIAQRLCGWEVRGGLGYEALDPVGGARDFLVDAAARYARPFTPYSQLSLEVNFNSTFEFTEDYTLRGFANYTYRFDDNVDTDFRYSFLYQGGEETFYHQNFSATAEVGLREDLSTSVTLSLSDNKYYEEMVKEITLGLSYKLL